MMDTDYRMSSNLILIQQSLDIAGDELVFWLGPNPTILISDPELIKEMMNKHTIYQKPHSPNPLTRLLARGVVSYETDKWSKHRKIINPAFHLDKLKVLSLPLLINHHALKYVIGKRRKDPSMYILFQYYFPS